MKVADNEEEKNKQEEIIKPRKQKKEIAKYAKPEKQRAEKSKQNIKKSDAARKNSNTAEVIEQSANANDIIEQSKTEEKISVIEKEQTIDAKVKNKEIADIESTEKPHNIKTEKTVKENREKGKIKEDIKPNPPKIVVRPIQERTDDLLFDFSYNNDRSEEKK